MSKRKSTGKEKKKASQFVIRVDKTERDAFVKICDQLDTSAAREIRRFMREMVAAHAGKDIEPTVEKSAVVAPHSTDVPQVADAVQEPDVQAAIEISSEEPVKSKRKPK